MTTLSFVRLGLVSMRVLWLYAKYTVGHSRSNRIRGNLTDSGDILESAGIGNPFDNLLAESLEALLGAGHCNWGEW